MRRARRGWSCRRPRRRACRSARERPPIISRSRVPRSRARRLRAGAHAAAGPRRRAGLRGAARGSADAGARHVHTVADDCRRVDAPRLHDAREDERRRWSLRRRAHRRRTCRRCRGIARAVRHGGGAIAPRRRDQRRAVRRAGRQRRAAADARTAARKRFATQARASQQALRHLPKPSSARAQSSGGGRRRRARRVARHGPGPPPSAGRDSLGDRARGADRDLAGVASRRSHAAGAAQVAAYQDIDYAERYVDRVERIVRAEAIAGGARTQSDVARETARFLALWMCYDDVIRVASLKSRASRFARIRDEVRASRRGHRACLRLLQARCIGDRRHIAAPPGAMARARGPCPDIVDAHAGKGITLQSSSVSGRARPAHAPRGCGGCVPIRCASAGSSRRSSSGSRRSRKRWSRMAGMAFAPAVELARLPRLLKGYGETHSNGQEAFRQALHAHRR